VKNEGTYVKSEPRYIQFKVATEMVLDVYRC